MSFPSDRALACGNALVAFQNTAGLVVLGSPVVAAWRPEMVDGPSSYPDNPYIELPRLLLRLYTDELEPGAIAAGTRHRIQYIFSWIYQRRQIPGEQHQTLLLSDLEVIRNRYLQVAFQPGQIEGIPGFQVESVIPGQKVVHEELKNPFTDDPRLRVSVGELTITINGDISSCGQPG